MTEIRARADLPAKVGLTLTPEIPGREVAHSRETVVAKSVTDLYRTLKDQVEVRAWAFSLPPTGKTVMEKLGAYTNVTLTAHWKKDAPTVIYGAGEAFVPSRYPIDTDNRTKAILIKNDRTTVVNLVRQAVGADTKAQALERLGGKRYRGTAEKLRVKADIAYAKAKAAEVGLKVDIQSLPHTERAPFEKARKFYASLDDELEQAQKEGRDLTSGDIDGIINGLRRDFGLTPKAQRFEATADKTPKKRTITVARGSSNVILEAQAAQVDQAVAPKKSVRVGQYILLASELAGLAGGVIACGPRVPIETPPPGGTEIVLLPPSVDKITVDSVATALEPWNGRSLGGATMTDTGEPGFRDQALLFPSSDNPAQLMIKDAATNQGLGKATLALVASGRPEAFDSFLVINNVAYHLESLSVNAAAGTTNATLVDSEGKLLGTLAVNTSVTEAQLQTGVWGAILLSAKQPLGSGATQQAVNLVFGGSPEEQQAFFETLASRPIRALNRPLVTPTPPNIETPTPVNLNVSPEVKTALTQEKALNPDGSLRTALLHSDEATEVHPITESIQVTASTDTSVSEILTGKDIAGQRYIWNAEAGGWIAEIQMTQDWTHPEAAPYLPLDAFSDGSANLIVVLYEAEHPGLIPADAPHPYYKINMGGNDTGSASSYAISLVRDNQYLFTDPEETIITIKNYKVGPVPFAFPGMIQTKNFLDNVIYVIAKDNWNPTEENPQQTLNTFHGFDKEAYDEWIKYPLILHYINDKTGELLAVLPPPSGTFGFDPATFYYGNQLKNPNVARLLNPDMINIFPPDIQKQIRKLIIDREPFDVVNHPYSLALSSLPERLNHMIVYTALGNLNW